MFNFSDICYKYVKLTLKYYVRSYKSHLCFHFLYIMSSYTVFPDMPNFFDQLDGLMFSELIGYH